MSGSLPRIVIPTDIPANTTGPLSPEPTAPQEQDGGPTSTLRVDTAATGQGPSRKKRKDHRGGKKKRIRRQSFAAPSDDGSGMPEISHNREDLQTQSAARLSFYRLKGRNISNTSIESETLLDHRYNIQPE